MVTATNNTRQKHYFSKKSGNWWLQALFLGLIGIGLFLLLVPGEKEHPSADKLGNTVAQRAPEGAQPSTDTQRPRSFGLTDPRFVLGQHQPDVASEEGRAGRQEASSVQPVEPIQNVRELDALVAQLKHAQMLTPESAKEMNQLLKELRKQGVAVVPAIRAFLRSKEDVNFDTMKGGERAEYHTLRQALFDTLQQIGGDEAITVSLEQLGGNEDPAEIAMLARNLEEAAPGVYRGEALQAATNALQLWARGNEQVEVRPLFELLRDLGGVEAVTVLEQFPANATMVQYLGNKNTDVSPTVRMYALMALAGLPDGEGIPTLATLAADPRVPVQYKSELPFQMLAQASMDYNGAGKALVDLARAGQIPDYAWNVMGEALAGEHLQFPSQLSGDTLAAGNGPEVSDVEAPFMRAYYDDGHNLKYEERRVAADWSAEQVAQQLALIDKLLNTTSSPAGVAALQRARASLQSHVQ